MEIEDACMNNNKHSQNQVANIDSNQVYNKEKKEN
jgi:hypothetical protein